MEYLGNKEILNLKKTAFLASSTIPLDMVLKCYDWAAGKHEEGQCVISGFSSKLERDVLHFLIKSKCPVIMVLARRMYSNIPEELKEPIEQGRLLIISTFNSPRQTRATAQIRNKYVCNISDKVLIVTANSKSSLVPLSMEFKSKQISVGDSSQTTIT
jgi:predicted Rossmann fold nucleotide-binding protein DprA/Smf involved in DNA uptake